jgi:hypothetical protein
MSMRMRSFIVSSVLSSLSCLLAGAAEPVVSFEGVIVATQRSQTGLRLQEPHSIGDGSELWIVRTESWPKLKGGRLILAEYTYTGPAIDDQELEKGIWRFELRPAADTKHGCVGWAGRDFIRTSQAGSMRVPPARDLPCFVIVKRPVFVKLASSGVPNK